MPITGIPLPFISYGGTSIVTQMMAIGLALNVRNAFQGGTIAIYHSLKGGESMKITSLSLDIREKDFEEYEETLIQRGWKKVKGQHTYQKTFGETEVEIREHIAAFSAEVTLKLTARNERESNWTGSSNCCKSWTKLITPGIKSEKSRPFRGGFFVPFFAFCPIES